MAKYYDITNLKRANAPWNILLGQRANGKSYQVKKTCIEDALNGNKFIYLRRWKADLKESYVTSYFGDAPVSKISNGEWQSIKAKAGRIYLVGNKKVKGKSVEVKQEIGRYCALNEYERYKSQTFIDYDNIIYEEFITDDVYIADEPRLLQQFVSTIFRLNKGHVYLVGNTLTRVCPYFHEWCLEGVLKQKQGTIEIYHYHTDNEIIDIAVEYCSNTQNKNNMFFGQAAKQIVSGEWDVKEVPKLPRFLYEYEMAYELLIEYQSFKFVLQLLIEPKDGGMICYVYPYTKDRKIYRKITNDFSDLPNVTSKLDREKRPELFIIKCLTLDKVCYSDNLTGSDFKKVLSNMDIY